MKPPATMHTGPLGSTFHILRADPETVTALAAIDWNRHFRRVCLDPARGLITLMSPSFPHEKLSDFLDDIVEDRRVRSSPERVEACCAAPGCGGRVIPRGRAWSPTARSISASAPGTFVRPSPKARRRPSPSSKRTAPDLVVEVEITNVDASKTERYAEMGVRELWRLRSPRKSWEFRAELLALRPGSAPRKLDASEVLEGLTPDDVRDAVDGVRGGETRDARTKAVERVVKRRRDDMVRVREEAAAYSADGAAARSTQPDAARAVSEHVHMDSAVAHRLGRQAS